MTLGFASINEAWGEPVSTKRKKVRKDPLQSLYQQSQSPTKELDEDFMALLDEEDMVSHHKKDTRKKYNKYSSENARMPYNQYVEIEEDQPHVERYTAPMKQYAKKEQQKYPPIEDLGLVADKNTNEILGFDSTFAANFQELGTALKNEEDFLCNREKNDIDISPPVFIEEEEEPVYRDTVCIEEEEEQERPIYRSNYRRPHVERFRNSGYAEYEQNMAGVLPKQPLSTGDYVNAFLYIISGIFIIIMMEQVLRIGMRLR